LFSTIPRYYVIFLIATLTLLMVFFSGCHRIGWDSHSNPGNWKPPAQSGSSSHHSTSSRNALTMTNWTQNTHADISNGQSFLNSDEIKRQTVTLAWPLHGKVVSRFGKSNGRENRGIEIRAEPGSQVTAAADGKVAYVGAIRGYGAVVIIEHGHRLVTVYGGFGRTIVRKGMDIRRGHLLGTLLHSKRSTSPSLHFEVRLRSKPVDPIKFLEKTS
jgi:septal ring factor EnvC (AmiA/AmiB activator)